jgi:hypothetical protein
VAAVALVPAFALATPSTTYWAPSVATCQAKNVPHVTYDTYFAKEAAYPIDTGLTMGILPGDKVQAEVGYDLLMATHDPVGFYLNGKVCLPENSLGKGAPGIGVGVYNIGFHGSGSSLPANNYNTLYAMAQKTLPTGGYISGGFYYGLGTEALYASSEGEIHRAGAIVGFASPDIKVGLKGLSKILIIGDVMTGKNVLGAGGAGINFYFNDYIAAIVGPVFFFDKELQFGQRTLWTMQIDIDIPLGKP